jgi:hypothetical protein
LYTWRYLPKTLPVASSPWQTKEARAAGLDRPSIHDPGAHCPDQKALIFCSLPAHCAILMTAPKVGRSPKYSPPASWNPASSSLRFFDAFHVITDPIFTIVRVNWDYNCGRHCVILTRKALVHP